MKYMIRKICNQIKYKIQLIFRDYSDKDLYWFSETFRKRLIKILSKKKYDYYWNIPKKYINVINNGNISFNNEQQQAIIDTFIFHLKMCDEDFVISQLYDIDINNIDWLYISDIIKQNQDRALNLLKYFINDI